MKKRRVKYPGPIESIKNSALAGAGNISGGIRRVEFDRGGPSENPLSASDQFPAPSAVVVALPKSDAMRLLDSAVPENVMLVAVNVREKSGVWIVGESGGVVSAVIAGGYDAALPSSPHQTPADTAPEINLRNRVQ